MFDAPTIRERRAWGRVRERIEASLHEIIAILDAIDAADEDMEEDDPGGGDVLDEGEPNDWDNEPSLGAPEAHYALCCSQESWARGGSEDLEDEHDGREPEPAV